MWLFRCDVNVSDGTKCELVSREVDDRSSSLTPWRVRGAVRRRVLTLEITDLEIQQLVVLVLRTVGCE
jgi:hypothetical protein